VSATTKGAHLVSRRIRGPMTVAGASVVSAILARRFRIPGRPLNERSEQIVKPAPEGFGRSKCGWSDEIMRDAVLTKTWMIMVASYQIVT
jgi:hypothetical protein